MPLEQQKTLSEMRVELADALGFGGQVRAGINQRQFNTWLQRAQRQSAKDLPDALQNIEVFERITANQSSINYPSAIDFKKEFELTVDYSGDGNYYPLREGISRVHDSIYDEMPPRWQANTKYPHLGMRVVPSSNNNFYYELTGFRTDYNVILNSGLAITFAATGDGLYWHTGEYVPASGVVESSGAHLPDNAAFDGLGPSGVAIDQSTGYNVRVYAPRDDDGLTGWAVGDDFPWQTLQIGENTAGTDAYAIGGVDFSAATATANAGYVVWTVSVASLGGEPVMIGADLDVPMTFAFGVEQRKKSHLIEPTWPTTAGDTIDDGGLTWTTYALAATSSSVGWPRRYELLTDSIRLWPFAEAAYVLKINGVQRLQPLAEDTDMATIASDLVILLAIYYGKRHYRHPDKDDAMMDYRSALKFERAAAHGNKRYHAQSKNGQVSADPATRPLLLE